MSSSETRTTSIVGRRRPRPNSYTSQACERCRSRKQRCLLDSDDSESCRNCLNSRATCVYAARIDKPKKNRGESSVPSETDDETMSEDITPSTQTQPPPPSISSFIPPTDDNLFEANTSTVSPQNVPGALQPQPTLMGISGVGDFVSSWNTERVDTVYQQPLQTWPMNQPQYFQASPRDEESPGFDAAKGLAMISLEAAAEPHYVGESSGSLWSIIVSKGVSVPHIAKESTSKPRPARPRSRSPDRLARLQAALQVLIPDSVADHLLARVYDHLQARYPFMDWIAFNSHWQVRDQILLAVAQGRTLNREASIAAFFLLLVFAIGTELLKSETPSGLMASSDYYSLAIQYLPVIVTLHNLVNIQGLLLVAMYSLRNSHGPSLWHMSGVAMRLCLSLGLHRNLGKRSASQLKQHDIELRKRVFWTSYVLDRMASIILGRPPGISDDDIDVDLPDAAPITLDVSIPFLKTCSVASAVHSIRLKQIESQIQRAVYTVANRKRPKDVAQAWALLGRIENWEKEIPKADPLNGPCCTSEWFQLRGVEARLHLLRALCTGEANAANIFLSLLATNAAKGCELQKRTHRLGQPLSSTSLHSTFTCGFVLLYAIFLSPSTLPLKEVFSAIKATSNTLFAYSQGDWTSVPLYDVFEELSSICIERITQQAPTTREPILPAVAEDWRRASVGAAQNTDNSSTSEYHDLLRTLGISLDDEPMHVEVESDSLWDLSAFSPRNISAL